MAEQSQNAPRKITDIEVQIMAEGVKQKSQLLSLIRSSSSNSLHTPFIINTLLLVLIYNFALASEVRTSEFILIFLFYITGFGLMDRINRRLDALVELLDKQKLLD